MNFIPDIKLIPFSKEFIPELSILLADAYMVIFPMIHILEKQSFHCPIKTDKGSNDRRVCEYSERKTLSYYYGFR